MSAAVQDPVPLGTVEVVICAYTMQRWPDIVAAVRALGSQSLPPDQVTLIVDHNPQLHDRAMAELPGLLPGIRVLENRHPRGLSGARNTAIAESSAEFLAFLDDDATPEPDWLAALIAPFDNPAVYVTGGRAIAAWPNERPGWFPPEFDWVVGCSYLGMPTASEPVRNVIGCSMAFRAEVFDRVGGFTEGIGRVGTIPLGCEETELCIRIGQAHPGAEVHYVPGSVVHHRVSADRIAFGYFRRRCLAEGRSKALIGELIGHQAGTSSERSYATRTLPAGLLRALRSACVGDRHAALRAGAIVAGLLLTTSGYLRELIRTA